MTRCIISHTPNAEASSRASSGHVHLSEPLIERYVGATADTGWSGALPLQFRRDLCRREAAAIQAAAMGRRRDREIGRLSTAFTAATAEIERLGVEHTINAAEIVRLNLAYGALEAETKRVNEAYENVLLELRRVSTAYGGQQATLSRLKAGLRPDEADPGFE